ncbi:nucleoside triphosphate pyrophosphohydrolase [Lacibacterium aquatile]|uniref:Nucleoside triphosphate pyrophosphohydrolase n=1 Tax=Lacibacterium aquatile TaxID=1168082 RepID=A0ABW5DQ15_9PROT
MTVPPPDQQDPFRRLQAIMAQLRDKDSGCPWDIEQTFATIAPYTVEEAYEVADAIERGDKTDLKDELGDLLLQVVFHARMAEEEGSFTLDDVAEAICAKMIRRHPHVFDVPAGGPTAWEDIKAAERAAKGKPETPPGALDGISVALPGLSRALKLQQRAARVSFDWSEARSVFNKLTEEIGELEAEMTAPQVDGRKLEDELGDVLFCAVNLARHLKVDPEAAIRSTNAKFERRFRRVESLLADQGRTPTEASLDEMEALWVQAKIEERT